MKASAGLEDDTAPALSEVIEHKTTRTLTRRTAAVGKPGEPGYVPPGEVTTETIERHLRVKLHDKVQALVNISRYLGILADHAPAPAATGLPRGFFAAWILRDPSKLQGVAPELLELPSEGEVVQERSVRESQRAREGRRACPGSGSSPDEGGPANPRYYDDFGRV